MKSLLLTACLGMSVAHSGAFLSVWELPYVEDHLTIGDLGRKLNKVFKWKEFNDSLRQAREQARDENYAMYDEPWGERNKFLDRSTGHQGQFRPMRSKRTSSR